MVEKTLIGDPRIYQQSYIYRFDKISTDSPDAIESIETLFGFYKKVLATILSEPICEIRVTTLQLRQIERIFAYFNNQVTGGPLFARGIIRNQLRGYCEWWLLLPTAELHTVWDYQQFADIPKRHIPKFLFTFHVDIGIFRRKAADVCFALQDMQLPVLLTLLILDELMENDIRMWVKWTIAAKIKHFHDRLGKTA